MLPWLNLFNQNLKLNIHPPAHLVPACASRPEFLRLWTCIGRALSNPNGHDLSTAKGEDNIPTGHLPHCLVEVVLRVVPIHFGRPHISPRHFVIEGLVLANPPELHLLYAKHMKYIIRRYFVFSQVIILLLPYLRSVLLVPFLY